MTLARFGAFSKDEADLRTLLKDDMGLDAAASLTARSEVAGVLVACELWHQGMRDGTQQNTLYKNRALALLNEMTWLPVDKIAIIQSAGISASAAADSKRQSAHPSVREHFACFGLVGGSKREDAQPSWCQHFASSVLAGWKLHHAPGS